MNRVKILTYNSAEALRYAFPTKKQTQKIVLPAGGNLSLDIQKDTKYIIKEGKSFLNLIKKLFTQTMPKEFPTINLKGNGSGNVSIIGAFNVISQNVGNIFSKATGNFKSIKAKKVHVENASAVKVVATEEETIVNHNKGNVTVAGTYGKTIIKNNGDVKTVSCTGDIAILNNNNVSDLYDNGTLKIIGNNNVTLDSKNCQVTAIFNKGNVKIKGDSFFDITAHSNKGETEII